MASAAFTEKSCIHARSYFDGLSTNGSGLVALFPFALSIVEGGNGSKTTYTFDLDTPLESECTGITLQILGLPCVALFLCHTQNAV